MRNEELAKLNRVVLKYEVKDSTECSDFAVDALGVPFGRAMPCFHCLLLNLYKSIVYRRLIIVYRNRYFRLTIGSVCDTILIVK